ncbi:M24 family metallopeptidase [Marinomonas agarivorans]|nr:M24 family metallopeptidase [Marinomonas agarivorans]
MPLPMTCYQERRTKLQQQIAQNSVVILRAGSLCTRNSDCYYEFRPHSSFLYLTGYKESDAYLVITNQESILFNLPKDPSKELWDGFRHGVDGAVQQFGFDLAFPLTQLPQKILDLLDSCHAVYSLFEDQELQQQIHAWQQTLVSKQRQGAKAPTKFIDITDTINEMRLIKDTHEIAIMEQAAQISVEAHKQAMMAAKVGMHEYELEAELNYTFMKSGARTPAYNNIVASGKNACVLHYIENDKKMQADDLVLIDAGCELDGYASDITCTFPVNGKFTSAQAALYAIVLEAQKAAIEQVKVGAQYVNFHDAALRVLTKGLVDLGLLQGEVDSLIDSKAYQPFYMHNTGHWLGLDVHDAGAYKLDGQSRPLQAGMVVTVEPGLYVAHDNYDVDEQWRGIGIRIEDDVLVTENGPYILTHGLAREIADIEALMAR